APIASTSATSGRSDGIARAFVAIDRGRKAVQRTLQARLSRWTGCPARMFGPSTAVASPSRAHVGPNYRACSAHLPRWQAHLAHMLGRTTAHVRPIYRGGKPISRIGWAQLPRMFGPSTAMASPSRALVGPNYRAGWALLRSQRATVSTTYS